MCLHFAVDSTSDVLNISQMSTATQKRIKVRPALIADDESNNDEEDEVEVIHEKPRKKDEPQSKTAEIEDQSNQEHLETKKQIEDLRREYGDSWLHSKSASKVQNVMGIQHVPLSRSSVFVSSQSPQTTEQMLENLFGLESSTDADQRTSTPVHNQNQTGIDSFAYSPHEVRNSIIY